MQSLLPAGWERSTWLRQLLTPYVADTDIFSN